MEISIQFVLEEFKARLCDLLKDRDHMVSRKCKTSYHPWEAEGKLIKLMGNHTSGLFAQVDDPGSTLLFLTQKSRKN